VKLTSVDPDRQGSARGFSSGYGAASYGTHPANRPIGDISELPGHRRCVHDVLNIRSGPDAGAAIVTVVSPNGGGSA
jgi:hypothetical protein